MRIKFRPVLSSYREQMQQNMNPRRLTLTNAIGKISKAKLPSKAELVLGADTIVAFQGKLIGKPKSLSGARTMLGRLSGRHHVVYTGIAILDRRTGRMLTGVSRTKVKMRSLTEKQISAYFKRITPFDKAGAYAIQAGPPVVERIDGSFTNVMGLPEELLREMMNALQPL
jgi:septum formation protein